MDNPQINNITVALAMTRDEQGMIQYAMHYAEMFNASLTVIHVQDPHAGGMSMMMDAPEKFSEEDISNFRKNKFLIDTGTAYDELYVINVKGLEIDEVDHIGEVEVGVVAFDPHTTVPTIPSRREVGEAEIGVVVEDFHTTATVVTHGRQVGLPPSN